MFGESVGEADIKVASFAEAWIEIPVSAPYQYGNCGSPPSRRRGLKSANPLRRELFTASPPSRRRGLKSLIIIDSVPSMQSPPSRRRGLKLEDTGNITQGINVASFAEAWIEIDMVQRRRWNRKPSPPSRRRGLKSDGWSVEVEAITSPPSRRRGLKCC